MSALISLEIISGSVVHHATVHQPPLHSSALKSSDSLVPYDDCARLVLCASLHVAALGKNVVEEVEEVIGLFLFVAVDTDCVATGLHLDRLFSRDGVGADWPVSAKEQITDWRCSGRTEWAGPCLRRKANWSAQAGRVLQHVLIALDDSQALEAFLEFVGQLESQPTLSSPVAATDPVICLG